MGLEVLVLGVISGLRPATSQAAVFALLRAPAAARSLLAFSVAGLIASITIGLIIILAFGGVGSVVGRSTLSALFALFAGVASLGFAAGVARGGLPRRGGGSNSHATSALAERLRHPSTAAAALAGVGTHIPGLIYLVALNSIAAARPTLVSATVQVLVYNLLWFAVPLAALTLAIRSPESARVYLDRATAFARRHQDRILVALFGTLGVYLIVKGVLELT